MARHDTVPSAAPNPIPAPLDQFLAQRDPGDDQLITALMRLAELVANDRLKEMSSSGGPTPIRASDTSDTSAAAEEALAPLHALVTNLFETVDANPALANLLQTVPRALGNGTALLDLFQNLFPQPPQRLLRPDGKGYLTVQQGRVLDVACSHPLRSEIAGRLHITQNTVDTHFRQIYKRLGVVTQEQAIARAYALGYLETSALHPLLLRLAATDRKFSVVHTLCMATQMEPRPTLARTGALAQVGLFLLLTCALVGREESARLYERDRKSRAGAIARIDLQGNVLERWEVSDLGPVRALVIAPPQARRHGFTPGNIFALHDSAQQHLNRGAITEFSPQGKRLRTFQGGGTVQTRLIGTLGATFDADGLLLVTSGWLTDAILSFEAGGSRVRRFAEGHFEGVAAGPDQHTFAIVNTTLGSWVVVFDKTGTPQETILPVWKRPEADRPNHHPGAPDYDKWSRIAGDSWGQLAVDGSGRILVAYDGPNSAGEDPEDRRGCRRIDAMDRSGNWLATFRLPDYNLCPISVSPDGRICSTCKDTYRVCVLDPEGRLLMHPKVVPGVRPFHAVLDGQTVLVGGDILIS